MSDVWELLNGMLETFDADFSCDICSLSVWGGKLRVTLTNPNGQPARSIVFYSTGGSSPEEVAMKVLEDFWAWHHETGAEPLPPSELLE